MTPHPSKPHHNLRGTFHACETVRVEMGEGFAVDFHLPDRTGQGRHHHDAPPVVSQTPFWKDFK